MVKEHVCSPDIELLAVRLRPYYHSGCFLPQQRQRSQLTSNVNHETTDAAPECLHDIQELNHSSL